MIGTNCYLVINEETKDTVMVDPGAYPTKLKNAVKEQGLKLKAVLLTHAHFDHIMVGIVCGGYSSVCVTGALWYVMKTKVGKKAQPKKKKK